jgi:hypothetical protein
MALRTCLVVKRFNDRNYRGRPVFRPASVRAECADLLPHAEHFGLFEYAKVLYVAAKVPRKQKRVIAILRLAIAIRSEPCVPSRLMRFSFVLVVHGYSDSAAVLQRCRMTEQAGATQSLACGRASVTKLTALKS